jgi:methyl-accepting chemotaxis protein
VIKNQGLASSSVGVIAQSKQQAAAALSLANEADGVITEIRQGANSIVSAVGKFTDQSMASDNDGH